MVGGHGCMKPAVKPEDEKPPEQTECPYWDFGVCLEEAIKMLWWARKKMESNSMYDDSAYIYEFLMKITKKRNISEERKDETG